MYFTSTIKPQLVTKRETCNYYWTFRGNFGQMEAQNWLAKTSNNDLSFFLLLSVGEYFDFTSAHEEMTCDLSCVRL